MMLGIGVFLFCSYVLFYGSVINTAFPGEIEVPGDLSDQLNFKILVFIMMMEGVGSSLIVAFSTLQWYKNRKSNLVSEPK